ncbi:MAG TPA: hypothetical protein VKY70_15755 [Pseudomonas sp.]|jgi:hypothetical protein|nr:hypothetical protein [Pseudomonas sp.]
MSNHHHAERAISALREAFAPLDCYIVAPGRKGGFSFTLVDQHGVARHSERLYPEHLQGDRLQQIIERTRQKALQA